MVRVNSPGICSVIKSRPCHVRRSFSRASLDVKGRVVREKVWMFEGMKEGISAEHLSEEDTKQDARCPNHNWFLFTNLLAAQQCAKCTKRILTKRAAYKCTTCKRLCHLKCAVDSTENKNISKGPRLRERKGVSRMDFKDFVPKEDAYSCRYERKTSTRRRPVRERSNIEEIEEQKQDDWPIDQIVSIDTIQQRQMADVANYNSDVFNASRQSQARQKLNSMKHGFVKKCRSFKKKVKTLKSKVQHTEESKLSDDQVRQGSTTTTSSQDDQSAQREAWVRSPIRTRLRERQLQLRKDSFKAKSAARRANSFDETSVQKVAGGPQMRQRNSKRHRFQIYDLDLVTLSDRVSEVEKRVNELETAIPHEIAEWHKLKQRFNREGDEDVYCMRGADFEEEQIIHETHPKHAEAMGNVVSGSSGTTSDEVYIVPDHHQGSSSIDDGDHITSNTSHLIPNTSLHEDSLPSGIPGRLRLNLGHEESEKQQTSTPVTDREMSFLSASRAYRNTHQVQHTNITQISMQHSYHDQDQSLSRKENIKLERSVSFEKSTGNVLSPEQIAVKSFLQKRRKSSLKLSGRTFSTSPSRRQSRSPDRNVRQGSSPQYQANSRSRSSSPQRKETSSHMYNSPPIASSTFREDDFISRSKQSEMSPLSFTLERNRFDNGQSFTEEHEDNVRDRNTSSASNFSYTFRNDSQMVPTNAEDDLPGYTRNSGMYQHRISISESDISSDINEGNGVRVTFAADIERASPTTTALHVKRDSISTQITTTTDDGLSLTNVTAVTGDFVNSFAEPKNNSNRSRWANKDVYMFSGGNEDSSRFAQVDAMGDSKKPPIPRRKFSSTSHIDFLREAEKRLEDYKMHKSGDDLMTGVHIEKLPRSTVFHLSQTDAEECKEHILMDYVEKEAAVKVHAELPYTSPKCRSPVKQGSPSRRNCSPKRNLSPMRKSVSPPKSPSLRRQETAENGHTSPIKSKYSLETSQSNTSLSPNRRSNSQQNSQAQHERSPMQNRKINADKSAQYISQTQVNSTSEFEELEKQLQRESLPHQKSFSLSNLQRYQPLSSNNSELRENAVSCTNSIDSETRSFLNENARYHFLHDKGMIKISSPSLKILNGSPATRRKYEPEYNLIDEESSDVVQSGSESGLSGVNVDNHFHLHGTDWSDVDFKQTESEATETLSDSVSTTHSLRQQKERELFEQCLTTADENQEHWDHVLDWMNNECNEENRELEQELNTLIYDGEYESFQTKQPCTSLTDDSVYYSFAGQSEDLKSVLSPLQRRQDLRRRVKGKYQEAFPGLMHIICNGTVQDVESYLNSDLTISEDEIKDALLWALDERNFDITMLLLEDICKLIQAAEGETCVEVFPAYLEDNRWQPIFVVLTKSSIQGEWDSFMSFPVYRRQYDLVSSESTVVLNSKYVRSHPLTVDDFRCVRKAVSSSCLQKMHSKITVINACPCRSRKEGRVLEKGLCIVIHCLIKGFIPFNEEPFPREINGIPVDVQEGYFKPGVATPSASSNLRSRDMGSAQSAHMSDDGNVASSGSDISQCVSGSSSQNDNNYLTGTNKKSHLRKKKATKCRESSPQSKAKSELKDSENDEMQETKSRQFYDVFDKEGKIFQKSTSKSEKDNQLFVGASVEGDCGRGGGSLGGFIHLPDGSPAFITCAHIFKEFRSDEDNSLPQTVYASCKNDSNRHVCGEVVKSFVRPGSWDSSGVDVAVVQITSNDTFHGNFTGSNDGHLENTVCALDFARGMVGKFADLSKDQLEGPFFKMGATTDMTNGQFHCDTIYVNYNLEKMKTQVELFNQFEIIAPSSAVTFFSEGDSGAAVFVPSNDGDLMCVGLAVGSTSYGSCIVTPIEAVFEALDQPPQFINFTS